MTENANVSINIETADARANIAGLQKELKRLQAELNNAGKNTDKYERALMELQEANKRLTQEVNRLQKSMNNLKNTTPNFNKPTSSIMNFFNKGKAGLGGLTKGMQGLSRQIMGLAGDFSLAEIAMGGMAAGAAVAIGLLTEFMLGQTDIAGASKEVTAELLKERETLDKLAPVLMDNNSTLAQKKAAMIELRNEYGSYLPTIDIEKASIEQVTALYNGLNQILLENVLQREKQKKIQSTMSEIIANEIDAIEKRADAEKGGAAVFENTVGAWVKYLPLAQQAIFTTDLLLEGRAMIAESTAKSSRESLEDIQATFDKLGANLAGLDLSTINQTTRQELERLGSAYKFMIEYAKRTGTELDTKSIENRMQALGAIIRKEEKDAQKALNDVNKRNADEAKRIADERKRIADARIVDNSLVDLRNKVAALRKELEQYTSTTDEETQKRIAQNLRVAQSALDKAEQFQKALLENEKSAIEKELAELQRLQTVKDTAFERAMTDLEERRTAALKGANDELQAAKINASFAAQIDELQKNNAIRVNASQIAILQKEREILTVKGESVDKIDLQIAQLDRQAKALSQIETIEKNTAAIRLANAETEKLATLNALESERVKALQGAQTKEQIDEINASYDRKQAQTAAKTERKILELRKDMLLQSIAIEQETGQKDGLKVAELRKELEEINGQILQTDRAIADTTTKTGAKLSETVAKYADFAGSIIANVLDVISTIEQAQTDALEARIERSKNALDELLSNTETTNVQQIELEKERLNALQDEREKAANRERAIANLRIATELAVGIAKAVSEGGGLASAITVAAALSAAAIGFTNARTMAKNAYFDGTTYLSDSNAPKGRDKINIWANEGEAIIPTATNAKYKKTVEAVYNQSVPFDVLNGFVDAYHNRTPFAQSIVPLFVGSNVDNTQTNEILARIENKLGASNSDNIHITEKGLRRFTTNAAKDETRKQSRRGK